MARVSHDANNNPRLIATNGSIGTTSHAVFTPVVVGGAAQAIGNLDNTWNLTLRSESGFTYVWNTQSNAELDLPTGWSAAKSSTQQTLTIATPQFTANPVNETITPTVTSTHTMDGTTAVHRLSVALRTFEPYFFGQVSNEPTTFVANTSTDLDDSDIELTSGTVLTFTPTVNGTREYAIINIHSSFGTPMFHSGGFPVTTDTESGTDGYTSYIIAFKRILRLEITT